MADTPQSMAVAAWEDDPVTAVLERQPPMNEARRRFVEDLEVGGEAVPEGTEPLPPGATHEVEEERHGEPRRVRRRRFTAH
jgi:hypothetical protein